MFTFQIGLLYQKLKILPKQRSFRNPFPLELKAQYQIEHEPSGKILLDFLQLLLLPSFKAPN